MIFTRELLQNKIKGIVENVKEQRYDNLEKELIELEEIFFQEKQQYVTSSEIKALIEEIRQGFEKADVRFEEINKRFEDMNKRFEDLMKYTDKRFDDVNKRFEDLMKYTDKRFDDVNKRFEDLMKYTDKHFDDMNRRFEDLMRYTERRFSFMQWMIMILFSSLLSIMFYFHTMSMNAINDLKTTIQVKIENIENKLK